jgi:hypothetical protein
MGRRPIIRETILKIFEETNKDYLSFSEIKINCEKKLNRKVHDSNIHRNLKNLINNGSVEKILIDGKPAYKLTQQYCAQSLKNKLIKIIKERNANEFTELLHARDESVPHAILEIPPQEDIFSIGIKAGEFLMVEWKIPHVGIADTLFNDFIMLPKDKQDGIVKLLAWSYWTGVRCYIEKSSFKEQPLKEELNELKEDCKRYLEKAKRNNDENRVKGERAILKTLKITEELITKENLKDFLTFIENNRKKYEFYIEIILNTFHRWPRGGELIFNEFMNYMYNIFDGLNAIGLWKYFEKKLKYHILNACDVLNYFIKEVFNYYKRKNELLLKEVHGTFNEAKDNLKGCMPFIEDLTELLEKRKFVAIYLWNFEAIDTEIEKCYKLPQFEDWFRALKEGRLNHRIWLFDDRTIKEVEKACRRVRRGMPPENIKIDKEPWTLRDLFEYHPMGKDPSFWEELINILYKQKEQKLIHL